MASMKDYVNPFGWMRVSKVEQQSEELIQRLRIKTPSGNQLVKIFQEESTKSSYRQVVD